MNRVCLLTGASGTLGTSFCQLFADQYQIVAVYRKTVPPVDSQIRKRFDPLSASGQCSFLPFSSNTFAIQADLLEPGGIERVLDLSLARFGHVDLLVNAAANCSSGGLVTSEILSEVMAAQFELNVLVPIKLSVGLMRKCWRNSPSLNKDRRRNIVNISSVSATKMYKNSGQTIYRATKAALNAASLGLADEFSAYGVRVNVLCPNSFPRRISTKSVVEAIVELDMNTNSGTMLEIGSEAMVGDEARTI